MALHRGGRALGVAAHVILDARQPAISPGALVITDGIVTAAGANVTVPPGACSSTSAR